VQGKHVFRLSPLFYSFALRLKVSVFKSDAGEQFFLFKKHILHCRFNLLRRVYRTSLKEAWPSHGVGGNRSSINELTAGPVDVTGGVNGTECQLLKHRLESGRMQQNRGTGRRNTKL
jgi:hypothetical protein